MSAVKIADAIKIAGRLVGTGASGGRVGMDREEAAAVQALVAFAKRVREARPAIRRLADLVDPETHLNQQAMFEEPVVSEEPDR